MDRTELQKSFRDFCEIHSLKNASLSATDVSGNFVGFLGIDVDDSPAGMFESIANVGRLWQHARTAIVSFLNDFERGK